MSSFRNSLPLEAEPPRPTLLLVDDDPLIVEALAFSLRQHFSIRTASTRQQALDALDAGAPPSLALIDLGLPPQPHRPDEGFALIKGLLSRAPQTRVLVLTGQSDEANGRRARTLGAIEFIAKPCDPGTVLRQLNAALALDANASGPVARGLVGNSPPLQKLRAQLAQFADSPFPVLIEGESGSGKEIVARQHLHADTRRGTRPFLALNCAAISPGLVEPMLFGYAKGAFTGASGARTGYFEDVADGTLFLDEIGELPLDLQAKLLRVLEDGEFQRVGETQTRHAKARIVAATNRDLHAEMRAGRFRVDLFHRLSVFTLDVPPLREMGDDRLLLLEHFRALHVAQGASGAGPFRLDPAAEALWKRYHFPGNVRELRNIVIRLTAKYANRIVSAAQLESELDLSGAQAGAAGAGAANVEAAAWTAQTRDLLTEANAAGRSFDLDGCLRSIERGLLDAALEISQGNVSQAAKLLGISRTTLYSRIERTDGEGSG